MATIKVMTYNIRHGRGIDDRVDISRIADVLAHSEADIICLQEVDHGLPRSGMILQAEALADALDYHYAYATNFGIPMAGMGNAILSRFLIYSTWNNPLPFFGEPRGLLRVGIALSQGNIHVFCTHWGLDEHQRMKQAKECTRILKDASRRDLIGTIFCGDLNTDSASKEVTELVHQARLVDFGPIEAKTYPTDGPEAKIDYIFGSDQISRLETEIIMTEASDHLPILATLEIAPPTPTD